MLAADVAAALSHKDIQGMSRKALVEAVQALEEERRRKARRCFYHLFPDDDTVWDGPQTVLFSNGEIIHARHKYRKHMEFFRVGATHGERTFMAANRVGKTVVGCYEDSCHLTGAYPHWWEGKRFDRPTDGWIAGATNETTRDILQKKLLGDVTWVAGKKTVTGTGLIPGDAIGVLTWKSGIRDLVDTVKVRHVSGYWSLLGLKTYEQGRKSFEGTEKDFIHNDEEPPMEVYGEQLIRTMTTGGLLYLTYTPLLGMSEVVMQFLPADQRPTIDMD